MEKIYTISKGQLITVWVFGSFGWLYILEDESIFGFLVIPFVLIFYTIGWKDSRKQVATKETEGNFDREFVKNFLDSFKQSGGTTNAEGEALYEVIKLQYEQEKYAKARKVIVKVTRLLSEEARRSRN